MAMPRRKANGELNRAARKRRSKQQAKHGHDLPSRGAPISGTKKRSYRKD